MTVCVRACARKSICHTGTIMRMEACVHVHTCVRAHDTVQARVTMFVNACATVRVRR